MISRLHSNVHTSAMDRAAKSLGIVHDLCKQFEEKCELVAESDNHNKPSHSKDIRLILELIREQQIFQEQENRKHSSFSKIKPILQQSPSKSMTTWLLNRINKYKL